MTCFLRSVQIRASSARGAGPSQRRLTLVRPDRYHSWPDQLPVKRFCAEVAGGRDAARGAGGVATGDRQALVKALLDRIDKAHGAPGSRLPGERLLASSFGASRASVREVLGVLEALRVIERRPQSGIYLNRG